jgi:hypothetical protein
MRGELCPFDHGQNPVVLQDVGVGGVKRTVQVTEADLPDVLPISNMSSDSEDEDEELELGSDFDEELGIEDIVAAELARMKIRSHCEASISYLIKQADDLRKCSNQIDCNL